MRDSLEQAYDYCRNIASNHYENFPVASWLLPKQLRNPVSVIYAFARTADDFADEGDLDNKSRLDYLDNMSARLEEINRGVAQQDPLFIALNDTINQYSLPLELFQDLLTAFKMDITKKRYQNFDEVLEYCRYSANPVGRLLLHLYNAATPQNLGWSDNICSALQLINFLQDIEQDYHEMNRIYIPLDDMSRHTITEQDIQNRRDDPAMWKLITIQTERAQKLMKSGMPLGRVLKGRIGVELRMIISGGLRILDKLHSRDRRIYNRPRLTGKDKIVMLGNAIFGHF
jgi:squalene synthase HpnC